MNTYKIKRFYFKGHSETIKVRLTLAEAQAHCQNPETNSKTCTRADANDNGPWFDGYEKETD